MQFGSSANGADDDLAYERLRLNPTDLEVSSHMLGSGQFGFVWRGLIKEGAKGRSSSVAVAIKVLKATVTQSSVDDVACRAGGSEGEPLAERALVQLLLEARLHASLSHEHLVQLLGVQDRHQPVMLAMQLCEAGDLRHLLRQRSTSAGEGDFNDVQRRDMAVQAASGLAFLHEHLCLHRDVAARNVLLTTMSRSADRLPPCGYVLKLADLGLTRTLREEEDYYRVRAGDGGSGATDIRRRSCC